MDEQPKRSKLTRVNFRDDDRARIWDMHVGALVKETECLIGCGSKTLIYKSQKSGFVAAHIIADVWMQGSGVKLSKYYGFPTCGACNNDMQTACLFDYLYSMDRIAILRRVIRTICLTYLADYGHELVADADERLWWKILNGLYGQVRFPLGGYLTNTQPIYEIARAEQMAWIRSEMQPLQERINRLQDEYTRVLYAEMRPRRLY